MERFSLESKRLLLTRFFSYVRVQQNAVQYLYIGFRCGMTYCFRGLYKSYATLVKYRFTTTSSFPGLTNTLRSSSRPGAPLASPAAAAHSDRSCLVSHPSPRWKSRHRTTAVAAPDATSTAPLSMYRFRPVLVAFSVSSPSVVTSVTLRDDSAVLSSNLLRF